MARLYANENFYLPVVVLLRKLGHDVLTSLEAGRANLKIPDTDVLAFAIAEKRCILTLNRMHFGKLHATIPSHFGIITERKILILKHLPSVSMMQFRLPNILKIN